jgi:tetratricopeptide (TPR) repeat protein
MHGNLNTSIQPDRYPFIVADWPNIHAALTWGMRHTLKTVFDFAWALNSYMEDHLARDEWRAIIEGLLHVAQETHNLSEQGHALMALGTIFHLENNLQTAIDSYTEALDCYEQIDTTRGLPAKAINDVSALGKHYETARDLHDHVLFRPNTPYKQLQQLLARYPLHDAQITQGHFAEARETLLQIMDLYRQLRDERGQCDTLTNMGVTAALAGNLEQARDDFAWALRMSEGVGYALGEMKALWSWGQAEYQHRQTEAGCALCVQAIVAIMASSRLQDHPRADELRRQLAAMDCRANFDAE